MYMWCEGHTFKSHQFGYEEHCNIIMSIKFMKCITVMMSSLKKLLTEFFLSINFSAQDNYYDKTGRSSYIAKYSH